ncbi:STAS domain-containing protein [Actinospica robiniae]|uniref:Anti-sigma factor antagonist n=1 Tax=Actinospica robiniae DSM 44927 TaxID=479430 RepID=W9DZV0_9ACTN|nr:STAS domain-containing protein [Actinospica robiniae]ETA71125.1 anti-anti-sigma factor [Actinospica robiniae DSM 44927]
MIFRVLSGTSPARPGEVPVVQVTGELDFHNAARLREALVAIHVDSGKGLVLDLSELTYCDSTGITVLIGVHQRAEAAGGRLVLAAMNTELSRTFAMIGLDQIFSTEPSVEGAVERLESAG